jgi:two-component system LytT family sensor kinase
VPRGGLIVAAWTLLAIIRTPSALLVNGLPTGSGRYWGLVFAEVLASLVPWMLATPLILLIAEKLPLGSRALGRQVAIHFPLGVVITVVASGAGVLLMQPFLDSIPGPELAWWTRQTAIASFYAATSYIAVLGVGYATAYFQRYQRREQMLLESRLQALTAQLNPHFLFNTLNSISALGYEDPALADESLSRLSDILRKTLSAMPAQIPLEQEISLVRQYAELYAMLIPDRIRVQFDIDANAGSAAVPSMFLQPLVENAITHGVSRLEQGGSIIFNAHVARNRLLISLSNDGLPTDGPAHGKVLQRSAGGGLGLANVRERLQVLYGDEHEFEFKQRPEGGVVVSLSIPFRQLAA